jgi:transposase
MPPAPWARPGGSRRIDQQSRSAQEKGSGAVVPLGELVMILDLHRQGLTISAIAREVGIDRKTVRRCIARGLDPPVYGPRKPRQRLIDPFLPYLRERATAYPALTGRRLWRELRERCYAGGYTAITDVLRDIRPSPLPTFEIRFETPPGIRRRSTSPSFRSSSPTSRR